MRPYRHPVADQPRTCGQCRAFDIPTLRALVHYGNGGAVLGDCRRFAPRMEPDVSRYPRVWSNFTACEDALGALEGERMGPLA